MGTELEGKLQLRSTIDSGATWTFVGAPMEHGEDLGLGSWLFPVARGGSVLMLRVSTGYGHFVSGIQFVTSTGVQQLKTEGHFVLPRFLADSIDVSPDGEHAATWEVRTEGPAELLLIGANGIKRVLLTSSEPGQVRFPGH